MPGYSIPPWIGQPADPAAHFAQGYQIGAHVGAQQAAHLFQQQQLAQQQQRIAMQQQQQEYENQMQAQVLNLKVSEAARQHQAAAAYQARVASGEDPSRVLMDMAPMLGESAGSVLHDQRMRDQTAALQNYRLQNMQRLIGASEARQRRDAAMLEERQKRDVATDKAKKAQQALSEQREKRMALASIERDQELKALRDAYNTASFEYKNALTTPTKWYQLESTHKEQLTTLQKNRDDAEAAVTKRLNELRDEFGLDEPAAQPQPTDERAESETAPESATTATSPPEPKFVVGKTYVDAQGNQAVYQENGSWQAVEEQSTEEE